MVQRRSSDADAVVAVRKMVERIDAILAGVRKSAAAGPTFAERARAAGRIPGKPIETSPPREKVPDAVAQAGPPGGSSTADAVLQTYCLNAAVVVLAGMVPRAAPDLRVMLREEVGRQMTASCSEFLDALERAKRQVISDIRAGLR